MIKRGLLLLTTIIMLLNLSTAAATYDSGGGGSGSTTVDGWTKYQDNIDSCDGTCTTSDDFSVSVSDNTYHVDSGQTGYCGVGGLKKSFYVPEDSAALKFSMKAWNDYWGSGPLGVRVNGEWLQKLETTGGETDSWSWDQYSFDMSEYAGQNVTVRFEIADTSSKWCDMSDHGSDVYFRNVSFESTDTAPEMSCSDVRTDEYVLYYDDNKDHEIGVTEAKKATYDQEDGKISQKADDKIQYAFSNDCSLDHETSSRDLSGPEVSTSYDSNGEFNVGIRSENSDSEPFLGNIWVKPVDADVAWNAKRKTLFVKPGESSGVTLSDIPSGNYSVEIQTWRGTYYNEGNTVRESGFMAGQHYRKEIDLSDIDSLFPGGSVVVYGDYREEYGELAQRIASENDARVVKDSQVYPETKENNHLILVGGPAINSVTQELAAGGKARTAEEWSDHREEARIHLVPDAYFRDQHALVISSYNDYQLKQGVEYAADLLQGEKQDAAEGEKTLTISVTRELPDFAVEKIETSRNSDGSYEVKATLRGDSGTGFDTFSVMTLPRGTGPGSLTAEARAETSTVSWRVRPSNYDRNSIEVGLVADPENEIEESNEQNNRKVTEIKFDRTEESYSIQLNKGWNMVSVPEMETDTKTAKGFYVSNVAEQCSLEEYQGEVSWRYSGGWEHPSAVESSQGVLLYSNEPCTAEIDTMAWPVTGDPVPDDRQLEKGWNMISVPEKMTLSEVGGSCSFESYEGAPVWHYLGNGEGWQRLGKSVNPLQPDRGYYVYTSADCEISFDGGKIEPPVPTGNFFETAAGWLK